MASTKIFISYAHKDEIFKDELTTQLSVLQRKGFIDAWTDREIRPGQRWDDTIKSELDNASVIMFLVSADFLASDYIHDVEIKKAIERYKQGDCRIVPVIIRPCHFQDLEIGQFQALPKNAKAISTWDDRDEAWYDVVAQLKKIIQPEKTDTKPENQPAANTQSSYFNSDDLDKLEAQGLKAQASLMTKRLNRIREALALEMDPSRAFQYETQIEKLEGDLAALKNKINS